MLELVKSLAAVTAAGLAAWDVAHKRWGWAAFNALMALIIGLG